MSAALFLCFANAAEVGYQVNHQAYSEKSGNNKATEKQHKKDFEAFDENNDGFVDAYEVRQKVGKIDQNAVSVFFIESDKNEDGKVSFEEYMHT